MQQAPKRFLPFCHLYTLEGEHFELGDCCHRTEQQERTSYIVPPHLRHESWPKSDGPPTGPSHSPPHASGPCGVTSASLKDTTMTAVGQCSAGAGWHTLMNDAAFRLHSLSVCSLLISTGHDLATIITTPTLID